MVGTDITGELARYMAEARHRSLPPEIAQAGKHRILDSLGAVVSGSRLKAGELALRYVRLQGGVPEASVLATDVKTSAVNAALANGMFGHADETDDFEPVTKAHPGCSVVPAALAMAEHESSSGEELLRAVVLGYDLCCRFLMALRPKSVRATHRSAEGMGSTMGCAAAAASLAKLDEAGMRYALSYAAQQVSGIWSWVRDSEHVEKAFDFAGMGGVIFNQIVMRIPGVDVLPHHGAVVKLDEPHASFQQPPGDEAFAAEIIELLRPVDVRRPTRRAAPGLCPDE